MLCEGARTGCGGGVGGGGGVGSGGGDCYENYQLKVNDQNTPVNVKRSSDRLYSHFHPSDHGRWLPQPEAHLDV